MTKLFFTCMPILLAYAAHAQSNPYPYKLDSANYLFDNWAATAPANTFPKGIVFQVGNQESPDLIYNDLTGDWHCGYNLGSRPRFLGLGQDGIAFLNTGSAQFDNCISGNNTQNVYIGGVVLGLNTVNVPSATLAFDLQLQTVGDGAIKRQYAVRLQYRAGTTGTYTDVNPVMELSSQGNTAGNLQHKTYNLPALLLNKPSVQFRWIYYDLDIANADGSRPIFRLDNITVTKGVTSIETTEPSNRKNIAVSPVPAHRGGTLSFSQKITGTVYNLNGQKLKAVKEQEHLDLSGLPSGMYFIKQHTGGVIKFVIE